MSFINKESITIESLTSPEIRERNNINWASMKCEQVSSKKMWVMIKTNSWLSGQSSKVLLKCWGIHLQPKGLEYLTDFSVKQDFWRTDLSCLDKIWQLLSFVSSVANYDSILSALKARAFSCPVANFCHKESKLHVEFIQCPFSSLK